MLTADGQEWVAARLLAELSGAVMVVGDGTSQVERSLDEGFPKLSDNDRSIVFQATFGPEDANFEWRGEGLRIGGELIEWEERDSGRKALGAIWTVQISLDLGA